jgi:uncharacterized protein DUF3298
LAASLTASLAAQSPGVDCANATTPQENAICASPELSGTDASMTAAYRSLLAAVPTEIRSRSGRTSAHGSQSGAEKELYRRISRYLHNNLDNDGEDQTGQRAGAVYSITSDPSRWQIDDKGITIVFNPYEVACYACTPEDFIMSWESLKPLLNPAFVVPRAAR